MIRDNAAGTIWQDVAIPSTSSQTSQSGIETQKGDLVIPPPVVASIRFPFPKLKTRGFLFSGGTETNQVPPLEKRRAPKPSKPAGTATRWKPPRDMVKLEDRLFCMLQPPLESLLQSSTIDFPFPPFAHQFSGVAFLFLRHSAILADEMGLGKTMQTITTIRLLMRSSQLHRILLVCPKPLVTNWIREFNLWAPEIPTCVVEGNHAKRQFLWNNPDLPVKIANYELMNRDLPTILDSGIHYDLAVLDEAQRIKNRTSATSKAVCQLPRRRSWALTGTPIENSTDDLVGIFEFLSPGYLAPGMHVRQLRSAVRDHILRRTKTEVLTDLPPLLNRDELLSLNEDQQATYEQAESDGVITLNEMGESITVQHVFELVLRLKQICNFDPATGNSAKLQQLRANLEEVIASGQKAIVFSQWVKTIEKITSQIPEANPLEYHGKVPSKKRDGILEQFKNDPKRHVLLMSYGAGSVGLNLQFSRYVFLFDQWWNPAVEDQAINRAHRIGSTGSVTVTRMISQGTIEERINDVLQTKRELFETVLSDTSEPAHSGLSREDIFGLFDLRANGKRLRDVA
ncbi:MAG: DEAD/DEAH box helicase [Pirellulaceae bacterium]|nr:DEAD/DEAH box helicase [Pirellulaceae bacterium]